MSYIAYTPVAEHELNEEHDQTASVPVLFIRHERTITDVLQLSPCTNRYVKTAVRSESLEECCYNEINRQPADKNLLYC